MDRGEQHTCHQTAAAKVELLALPNEILTRIAECVERRYPLRSTCKHICLVAGQVIYAEEISSTDGQMEFKALSIFAGLEHETSSSTAPFGRQFKLDLLSSVRSVRYLIDAGKLYYGPRRFGDKDRQEQIRLFTKLRQAEIVLFDRVHSTILRSIPAVPRGGYLEIVRCLASISRPHRVCLSPCLEDGDEPLPLSIDFAPLAFPGKLHSSSKGLWHPDLVVHHSFAVELSIENRFGVRPIVCYGAKNEIRLNIKLPLDPTPSHVLVLHTVEWILSIIDGAHPELGTKYRGILLEEEIELRARTRWEFICLNYSMCHKWASSVPALLVKVIKREFPALNGQVTFVGASEEKSACSVCGELARAIDQ